jgi:NADPH:quinone reductase
VRDRYPDGVDALLDLVNYAPGTYDAALKPGARVASPTGAAGEGPGRTNLMATPSPDNLQRLGALIADGTLRIPIQATDELAQAPAASVRWLANIPRASSPFESAKPHSKT